MIIAGQSDCRIAAQSYLVQYRCVQLMLVISSREYGTVASPLCAWG